MKNVLILLGPDLPLPAVCGGAIENLVQDFINYNEKTHKYFLNIITPYNNKLKEVDYSKYKVSSFEYIDVHNLKYRVYHIFLGILRKISNKNIPNSFYYLVSKKIRNRSYDLIILENGYKGTNIIKKNSKCPVVLHMHNDYVNIDDKRSYDVLRNVDEVWAVSNFIRNRIIAVNKNINAKTLYNGVDLNKFKFSASARKEIRHNLNIDDDDFVFIFAGRIFYEKGVLNLIRCFNKINKKSQKLIICGDIRGKKDQSYMDKVLNEARGNKNILLLGNINHEMLFRYYSAADCLVIPSIWNEAFGMIAVEGLACGIPIIASKKGALPEIVDNSCGIIFNDEDELAKDMVVMSTNETQKNYKQNARKRAVCFSLEKYTKCFSENIKIITKGNEDLK